MFTLSIRSFHPRLSSSDISQTTPSPSSAHPPFIPLPNAEHIPPPRRTSTPGRNSPPPLPVTSALVPQSLCECYSNTNTVRVWKYAVQTGLFVLCPSDGTCCGARVIQMSSAILFFWKSRKPAKQGCGAVTFLVGSGSRLRLRGSIPAPAPAPAPSKTVRRLRLRLRAKCTGSGGSGSGSGSDDQVLIWALTRNTIFKNVKCQNMTSY